MSVNFNLVLCLAGKGSRFTLKGYKTPKYLLNYFVLIAITLILIITRSTRLIFRCYPSFPRPPEDLKLFILSDYYD